MKKLILFGLLIVGTTINAQVGIGTLTPSPSSELEVKSAIKGVLFPRVNLTALNQLAPITGSGEESLLVYNLTTNAPANLQPGYYYWKSNQWQRIANTNDVISLVINDFSTILGNTNVLNQIVNVIHSNGGNVYYNGTNLTYMDSSGNIHILDLTQVVQDNETITTLVNNNNGTYTYTSENGTQTTINVPADVISNFSTILANTSVLNQIINVVHNNGGNVYYDGTTLTYMDSSGNIHVIDLTQVVQDNETITTLVNNNNGTYTYTSENGTQTTINIPADVISNFSTILANTSVLNQIINVVHNNGGNVYYDGTTLTYLDSSGNVQVINLNNNTDWKLTGNTVTSGQFLGSTNTMPLILKTNNTERVRVDENGNMGIGTIAPNSLLEVKGSMGTNVTAKTANYTAGALDYTIIYKHTSAATLTLPSAASCTGRVYLIINNGSTSLGLTPPVQMGASLTTTSLSNGLGTQGGIVYGNKILVQSDGTDWNIIQN